MFVLLIFIHQATLLKDEIIETNRKHANYCKNYIFTSATIFWTNNTDISIGPLKHENPYRPSVTST